jgi:hypothetical protein
VLGRWNERLVPQLEADFCEMRTHYQRRFFYASTIGLLTMYAGALILLILSFGGCAIMSGS